MPNNFLENDELMAAIDIGSNSFHLAIARLDHGEVRKIASMSEKVQLAAGLDENKFLSEEAQQRGLDCLSRFMGRLESVSADRLRIVATNALRQAKNADDFIQRANEILPKPIEIIAGREEARLIYLGVSHTNASSEQRLVIDIGGGSTEFIIGQGFDPLLTESLQMGCVAFTQKFFESGDIDEDSFNNAIAAARKEILRISRSYQKAGWSSVTGSSGTIKAVRNVLVSKGWADDQERITYEGVKKLQQHLLKIGRVEDIELEGVKEHRKAVFPAGVAVLRAAMKVLGIETIAYSDGALREGVMYDMLGRFASEDVRDRSVQALIERYSVDKKQAKRVVTSCERLYEKTHEALGLESEDNDLLRRTAYLHEIGLAVSHSGYHHHSAYLLQYSDIPGFSQVDQLRMAQIARNHRRKLKSEGLEQAQDVGGDSLVYLCLLLRLAVLVHRSRNDQDKSALKLNIIDKDNWQISVESDEEEHALLVLDLKDDIDQFKKWGVQLSVECDAD
ncbi:exopolyphosphatase [Psychrobacter sp. FDAARGOS_221]|uniref:exopolyphosphatase n=1 Tax=Psychrobacter sp. FDAARGOS_221 TaxID=1975705 RepID=UPI000BB5917B|nr:exopolyphosphatase [Psychrobacter sp. FDAARGOS_221]PNK60423.1 exopolyphosphatase [Psychrobacter sp. FDAARGOS_221]